MSPVRWIVVLLLALVPLSACGGDGDPSTVPASTGPVEATAATGLTEATDPLEGTWTTVITPALEEQAAVTAGIEPELVSNEEMFGGAGPITVVLSFEDGQMIHTAAPEGVEPEVGWSGVYDIVDDDTFVAGDTGDLYIEYTYAVDGDELVIDMVRNDYPTVSEEELAGEIYAQTVIYESAPFTRES
jgi:hypothetical protein